MDILPLINARLVRYGNAAERDAFALGCLPYGRKMRYGVLLSLALLIAVCGGCATLENNSQTAAIENIRQMFVGVWEGEHVDNDGKLVRSWIQNRTDDGVYAIVFIVYTDQGTFKSQQKGKWWIDGDKFYEIDSSLMDKPDIYQFEILNENEIRFKSLTKNYEFIDRKTHKGQPPTFI